MDTRLIAAKERQNQLEQKFRGNYAFFIPITELPHFMEGLSDRQTKDLNEAIQVLGEKNFFFLGELAIMGKTPFFSEGFIKSWDKLDHSSDVSNSTVISKTAFDLIGDLMKENGFNYCTLTSYPDNGKGEVQKLRNTKQSYGIRRSDAVRDYLIGHFGDSELSQGFENHSTPSIDPPESNRLKLEFNLSAEQAEFLQGVEQVATLTQHADNPIKLLITKAFLRAMQSEIPTNDMHKEYFIDTNISPIEFKEKDGILTVHMELPALFAGLVKDNIEGHPEKFETTQAAIGREIALAMKIQQNVQTLQIAA